MEKILTIVIPSFNTEQFIDKNVPSFLDSQILDEIELLLINDGSTDSTELKAKEYEKKYPKTVKVITKENGGHGSVINRGIMEAKGKYFKVVDGDDWVVTENLVCLIKRLQEIDCDMVINPYNIVYENNMEKLHKVKFNSPVVNKKVRFENIAKYYQKLPIHCITYRTDLLRDENLKVRENCYYEDNEFCFFPIPYVNSVLILDYPVYNYLMGQKGQSVSDKNALKNRDMFKQVVYDCINYYENNKFNKKLFFWKCDRSDRFFYKSCSNVYF